MKFSKCGPADVKALKKPFGGSRKGDNGVVLVVGGSRRFHGAPLSSVKAASRFVDLANFSSVEENARLYEKIRLASADFIAWKLKEIAGAAVLPHFTHFIPIIMA